MCSRSRSVCRPSRAVEQPGDRAFRVQQALALHLGGVGGQHRRDQAVAQAVGDLCRRDAGFAQQMAGPAEAARPVVLFHLVRGAAPDVVAVFRDVGEMREIAEGALDRDGLRRGQAAQQGIELVPGVLVGIALGGHAQAADALDALEDLDAFLFADGVAEDLAEQADVFDERRVLERTRSRGLQLCHHGLDGNRTPPSRPWGRPDAGNVGARLKKA